MALPRGYSAWRWAAGEFPPNLRKVEQRRRVEKWLVAHGYGLDMPKRCALEHHIPIIVRDLMSSANQANQTEKTFVI